MLRRNEIKLTAPEVKNLPVNTRVAIHGRDRRGYPTELECTVIQGERSKQLEYYDFGARTLIRIPIRTLDGVIHYYTVEKVPDNE